MSDKNYKTDVAVIGGGPAGLAAAIAARQQGCQVLLAERGERLGGILNQCIHDDFGMVRFGERLTGTEYAKRFIDKFKSEGIEALTKTTVTDIKRGCSMARAEYEKAGFALTASSPEGILTIECKALILATGCRESSASTEILHIKNIKGDVPSGIFTAGEVQRMVNVQGLMPFKRCLILGSDRLALIAAHRLTLEGAQVIGVYEQEPRPSAGLRDIQQCLRDFDIPLFLSKTARRLFGEERLEAVEICSVDEDLRPIAGTEEKLACDGLILSSGLVPENALAQALDIEMSYEGGPLCEDDMMTSMDGVFCCGNACKIYDAVDYISDFGQIAGRGAASYAKENAECFYHSHEGGKDI